MRARLANPRRLVLLSILFLVLVVALLFWARPIIRELVVTPVSYLVWAIGILVNSAPQVFFWTALLLILVAASYRSVVGRRSRETMPAPSELAEATFDSTRLSGQVAFWALKVRLANRGSDYYQTSFNQAVGRLLMDLIAYRFHLSPFQVEERLRDGSIEVPGEVRTYALGSLRRMDIRDRHFLRELWQSLRHALERWLKPGAEQTIKIDPRLAVVLNYIEEELEVPHGDVNR